MNQLSKNCKTKKLCLILAILVAVSCVLCGCGKKKTEPTTNITEKETIPQTEEFTQEITVTVNEDVPPTKPSVETEPESEKLPSPQSNIMPSIKEGSFLINKLSFNTAKSQKEIITIAKKAMAQEQPDLDKRFSENKTEHFCSYDEEHVVLCTRFDENENIDRYMYFTYSNVIRFEYIFRNLTTSSSVSIEDVIKDVESVFGELKDAAAFKSFIKDNSALIGSEGFDGVSKSFKTASGISVAVNVGSFGDPVYSVEAEYVAKI